MKKWIDGVFKRFGYISVAKNVLADADEIDRKKLKNFSKKYSRTSSFTNFTQSIKDAAEVQEILQRVSKKQDEVKSKGYKPKHKYYNGSEPFASSRPAMSRLFNIFARNPFGAYAFVARHHWAVRRGINLIRQEVINDGFSLKSNARSYKKRLKQVYKLIKGLKIPDLRVKIAVHLKLYGNAWVLPEKTTLGWKFKILAPNHILPRFDPSNDEIIGWDYTKGNKITEYGLNELLHVYDYNMDNHYEMGDPPLAPALLSIEGGLSGEGYVAQIFRSGGLYGHILSFKGPDDDDPFGDDTDEYIEEKQAFIDSQLTGMKNAGGIAAMIGLDKVWTISPLGKLENAIDPLDARVAKVTASCLDLPPEKLGVSRSQTLQYIPSAVENVVNSDFDKTINTLMYIVDDFINEQILVRYLEIEDVRMVSSGRYGAFTKNAADTIKTLAEAGPLITVNMALERILGWECLPPDHPRANIVLYKQPTKGEKDKLMPVQTDPVPEDYDFSNSMSYKEFKKFLANDFQNILKGAYESKEKTYGSDDESCDTLQFTKGEVKYFETIRKAA